MARVRLNQTQEVAENHRWLLERLESQGPVLNIFRALSHSPEALRRFMKFGTYLLAEGKLDPKLRELAILRVGALCRSPYEFSQHIAFGRRVGLSDDHIRGVIDPQGSTFEAKEMAVMAYAAELTVAAQASQSTFDAVKAFMNDEEIVELTLVIGFYNMVSRTLNALQVDVDDAAVSDMRELGVVL